MSDSLALALKYRPKTFKGVIGQRLTATVLDKMVEKGRVPQGLLFSGPSGTGKTSVARILGTALGATDLDIIEIDAASNGDVASVRSLIEKLQYSAGGDFRIITYDEAHMLSREAYNALLKTLEEPPAGTIFILVTTEPEKIPKTVKTRLMEFEFHRVGAGEILSRITAVSKREEFKVSPDLLRNIAERSDGSVRTALTLLDQVTLADISELDLFLELLGEHDTAPDLVAALLTGDPSTYFAKMDEILDVVGNPATVATELTKCLRDLMVLRGGGTLNMQGSGADKRHDLALRLEADRLLKAVSYLWDLKTKIRSTDDPRGNLELSLTLISDVFSRGRVTPSPAPSTATNSPQLPPRRLTLAELQQQN
jgi:DNA polymerase-3 subunit gamma/tau